MTFWGVAFVKYLCPGAVSILGFSFQLAKLPEAAKPALAVAGICIAHPAVELYDPAQRAVAAARVRALGRPAQLYRCRGTSCGEPLVEYVNVVSFKEQP